MTCVSSDGIVQNSFTGLKNLCVPTVHPFLLSPTPATTDLFTVSIVLSFPAYYILFFFFLINFIFGCFESLLLCTGLLQLRREGATPCCVAQASHGGGFFCCGARDLGAQASVLVAGGF